MLMYATPGRPCIKSRSECATRSKDLIGSWSRASAPKRSMTGLDCSNAPLMLRASSIVSSSMRSLAMVKLLSRRERWPITVRKMPIEATSSGSNVSTATGLAIAALTRAVRERPLLLLVGLRSEFAIPNARGSHCSGRLTPFLAPT